MNVSGLQTFPKYEFIPSELTMFSLEEIEKFKAQYEAECCSSLSDSNALDLRLMMFTPHWENSIQRKAFISYSVPGNIVASCWSWVQSGWNSVDSWFIILRFNDACLEVRHELYEQRNCAAVYLDRRCILKCWNSLANDLHKPWSKQKQWEAILIADSSRIELSAPSFIVKSSGLRLDSMPNADFQLRLGSKGSSNCDPLIPDKFPEAASWPLFGLSLLFRMVVFPRNFGLT